MRACMLPPSNWSAVGWPSVLHLTAFALPGGHVHAASRVAATCLLFIMLSFVLLYKQLALLQARLAQAAVAVRCCWQQLASSGQQRRRQRWSEAERGMAHVAAAEASSLLLACWQAKASAPMCVGIASRQSAAAVQLWLVLCLAWPVLPVLACYTPFVSCMIVNAAACVVLCRLAECRSPWCGHRAGVTAALEAVAAAQSGVQHGSKQQLAGPRC